MNKRMKNDVNEFKKKILYYTLFELIYLIKHQFIYIIENICFDLASII